MNILAVDTAGKTAGVALLQDDRLLYEVYLDAGMTHSETLMPMIDTCLKMCGMTCADIDLYGVNAGPGSFTGLRIGLAAVKGLAFPRETLCAPVSTLEALAAAHTGEGTVLCALDARRAQVYSAAFELSTRRRLLEDDARAVADLAEFVENKMLLRPVLVVTGCTLAVLCYFVFVDGSIFLRRTLLSFACAIISLASALTVGGGNCKRALPAMFLKYVFIFNALWLFSLAVIPWWGGSEISLFQRPAPAGCGARPHPQPCPGASP